MQIVMVGKCGRRQLAQGLSHRMLDIKLDQRFYMLAHLQRRVQMQSKGKALLLSLMTLLSVIGVSGASSAQSLCTDTSNGMPNGIWDPDHHEECDSGPNARGCTNTCEIEDGFQCVLPINFDSLDVVTYGGATGADWTEGYFERTQTVNTVVRPSRTGAVTPNARRATPSKCVSTIPNTTAKETQGGVTMITSVSRLAFSRNLPRKTHKISSIY